MPGTTSAVAPAAAARQSAKAILAEPRFHAPVVPRPLHGALHDIGRALEAPVSFVNETVLELGRQVPGGSSAVWVLLALIVLGVTALLAARGSRLALAQGSAELSRGDGPAPLTARELEQQAGAAERAGRYDEAIRFRFQAGLRRLAERERVSDAPTLVNGEIARILRSSAFDEIARRFDEVTYGGDRADAQDAEQSRLGWERLLRSGGG